MNRTTPRLPSGFNEFLPAEQIEFDRLRDIVRKTYEKYGASPTDTSDLELSEVLLAKGGGETEQEVYRFERGKNDLTMRYDLTVPLARYVAQHEGELAFPFTSYRIGKVHRAERAQAGRFREFYQADMDTIGAISPVTDALYVAIINEIFVAFNIGNFIIRLNNRRLLNGFFEHLGLAETSKQVLRTVDKREKITPEHFANELNHLGVAQDQLAALDNFMDIMGDTDEVLGRLRGVGANNATFQQGLSEMSDTIAALRAMGVPEQKYKIDLSIARGLDYYTGIVYETNLRDYPSLGSVCSGGRYDDLASYYTKTSMPGVGISIGLSRLFYKLCEAGIVQPNAQTYANVMVMPFDNGQITQALDISATLRNMGVAVLTYTEQNDLGKKFKFADRMAIRYVLLIGENEVKSETVAFKDMLTGENEQVAISQIPEKLQLFSQK